MPNDFGQFDQGKGQKYAPKPRAKAAKVAKEFDKPKSSKSSDEDAIRAVYKADTFNPRAQSTDHMN
jgi:hypothetical protein